MPNDPAELSREAFHFASAEPPDRYPIKESPEGRYLTCLEAPEVVVRIERELSVTAAAARKAPEGTIYLDGAAQAEPFLDLERQVYNLDHHEGCVRRFTLASCEQAMVLVLRGLDLRDRPWTIYANSPDLDTVLALWVLLNSVHLAKKDEKQVRRAILPLVRLEGVIDSQGLEMVDLAAFPEKHLKRTLARLDQLRAAELELAEAPDRGPLESTAALLRLVDELVYPPGFFESMIGVEELARDELTPNRIVVVCRGDSGIYELEPVLKRLFGKRLGVIALQKDERTYTLRQVDAFLPVNLEAVYRRLNLRDPAVKGTDASNRWGGSGEIGGSPRSTGTDLGPEEIAAACREACWRPSPVERLTAAAISFGLTALVMAAAWLIESLAAGSPAWERQPDAMRSIWFAAGGLVVALPLLLWRARSRRHLFGLQAPVGANWLWLAPPAVGAAIAGGAWLAATSARSLIATAADAASLLLLPLLAEATFRGLAHGFLLRCFRTEGPRGRWFVSWPAIFSGLLYALWTVPYSLPSLSSAGLLWPGMPPAVVFAAAFLFGIALAMTRERAASLVAPLALHYFGLAAVILLFGLR